MMLTYILDHQHLGHYIHVVPVINLLDRMIEVL
jgi:hypothetical protein